MCRITGLIQKNLDPSVLISMRDTLIHGGPDDCGLYVSPEQSVGLAQRRLSVIDLTSGGHQPMIWKQYVLIFNGEIYNYKEIASELIKAGYQFDTNSDTEVIIKAFDKWGYNCVEKFRGMFTFVLWNEQTKKLLICRDRIGVKPLYWYIKDGLFMFASELKAFHKHADFDSTINQEAVSLFLQTGYIRAPYCIFLHAQKLNPGSFLEIDLEFNVKQWVYYSPRDFGSYDKTTDDNELVQNCESILTEAFKLRMVADVPVGMFLSGGIDSSLVTALLQKDSSIPLNTFTIGFEDPKLNEAIYAKEVAKHLGTNHTEMYCTENHFVEILKEMQEIYDEPFGDSSGIPTYLVSKLARESVTVSLSADGGDELFTGYNRYVFAEKLFNKFSILPTFIRNSLSSLVGKTNVGLASSVINLLPLPEYYKKNVDARLPKLQQTLKAKSHLDFLYSSTSFITENSLRKIHQNSVIPQIFSKDIKYTDNQRYSAYGVADIESYLEGDILCKVDRATMRVSLEGREPFLDNKVVDFALSLPNNFKIRDGQTKWILRQILYKYVPRQMIERPKMGFGIPLDKWLSTLLVEDLFELKGDNEFLKTFQLNKEETSKLINLYLEGKSFSPYFIWYLYCLYKWYNKWLKK